MSATAPQGTATPHVKLAAEAYLYGFPLVYSLHEIASFVAGSKRFPMQAPYNEFGHARELAGPDFEFVSPNNDTVYTIAMCDVRHGPLVLHVPDTDDRYYVLQFIDAWSNNFAYVGRRATGTGEGEFLLAAHGYSGEVPEGMRVIHAPTGIFVIAGRIQVDGEADLDAAHKLLAQFPPPGGDASFLKLCEQFGLTAADTPYADLDPERAAVLVAGAKAGQAKIEELMKQVHASPAGWQSAMHMFDYNLDYFEIGTLDTPEWKIADRTKAYITRAVIARAGLWGNHGYEANYEAIWVDGDGNPLVGSKSYELHLPTPPPVDAFWSLTMYDVPRFYLVANPINRYSIGDRTKGLKYGDDGSLTIYIGNSSPGPERESNWLPAPAGSFRPILRMYQPQKPILDGTYVLPPIKVTGGS
jgi:hypothetical protein